VETVTLARPREAGQRNTTAVPWRIRSNPRRPGHVQRHGERVSVGERREEGEVDVLDVLLEHVVEIPHGLMDVDTEDEVHRFQRHAEPW